MPTFAELAGVSYPEVYKNESNVYMQVVCHLPVINGRKIL